VYLILHIFTLCVCITSYDTLQQWQQHVLKTQCSVPQQLDVLSSTATALLQHSAHCSGAYTDVVWSTAMILQLPERWDAQLCSERSRILAVQFAADVINSGTDQASLYHKIMCCL
jgi:hypothetical protein